MKRLDWISGLFLCLLGIFISIESYRVSLGDFHNPGPGFFPFLTGLAIAVLSFLLLIPGGNDGQVQKAAFFEERSHVPKLIFSIVSLFAYGLVLDQLGFILCTLMYIGFIGRMVAGLKWPQAILLAALSSFGSYILFAMVIKADLPRGLWSF